jgi:hypothetical protein
MTADVEDFTIVENRSHSERWYRRSSSADCVALFRSRRYEKLLPRDTCASGESQFFNPAAQFNITENVRGPVCSTGTTTRTRLRSGVTAKGAPAGELAGNSNSCEVLPHEKWDWCPH